MAKDFALTAPDLALIIGGLLMTLVAAFAGEHRGRLLTWLGVAVLSVALVMLAGLRGIDAFAFGETVTVDAFAGLTRAVIYASAIASLVFAPRYFRTEGYRPEFPVLVVLATLGMGVMVSARDLITLYVGLELNSLASYVLASFSRRDDRSSEAGLKYFVLGSLASGILLYGISLVYGFTGTTNLPALGAAIGSDASIGLLMGVVFVLAGLAFKISAAPFHMWTPDVYEGAPTPVVAFFATAPKIAATALLVRVCVEAMPAATPAWSQIVTFLAVASMVIGSIGAIGQRNIKRLLAYSSIANVGFILIGLAAGTAEGVAAVLFYLIIYAIMTFASFAALMMLRDDQDRPIERMADLAGMWRKRPWLAAGLAVLMFSLAGIPPLFGFWPKLLVFTAAVNAKLVWLAVVGAVLSVVGAFYYLRVIKLMMFDEPSPVAMPVRASVWEQGIVALAVLFVGVLGFAVIAPLDVITRNAAGALF